MTTPSQPPSLGRIVHYTLAAPFRGTADPHPVVPAIISHVGEDGRVSLHLLQQDEDTPVALVRFVAFTTAEPGTFEARLHWAWPPRIEPPAQKKCEYCDKPAVGLALGPVQPNGTRQHILACQEHGERAAELLRDASDPSRKCGDS